MLLHLSQKKLEKKPALTCNLQGQLVRAANWKKWLESNIGEKMIQSQAFCPVSHWDSTSWSLVRAAWHVKICWKVAWLWPYRFEMFEQANLMIRILSKNHTLQLMIYLQGEMVSKSSPLILINQPIRMEIGSQCRNCENVWGQLMREHWKHWKLTRNAGASRLAQKLDARTQKRSNVHEHQLVNFLANLHKNVWLAKERKTLAVNLWRRKPNSEIETSIRLA